MTPSTYETALATLVALDTADKFKTVRVFVAGGEGSVCGQPFIHETPAQAVEVAVEAA